MKIAVLVNGSGEFRIHHFACKDVNKEARHFHDTPWVLEAKDRHAVNLACWGDIASDTTKSRTSEWEKLCDEYASGSTTYLPCCAELPERSEG